MEGSIGSFPISHVKIETMLRYFFSFLHFFSAFSIYIIFLFWYVIRLLLCVLLSWILKRKQFRWLHEKFKPIPKVKFYNLHNVEFNAHNLLPESNKKHFFLC